MEALLDSNAHAPSALERTAADVLARVVSHKWVNPEYKHLVLHAPHPAPSSEPGQFFNLDCPQTVSDKPFFRRPMSTYRADPTTSSVEFLYKVTGAGTRGLASLRTGQQMRIFGPLGLGFSLNPAWNSIVVLGRGVGLATLAPLAELAAQQHVRVTAIFSARGPAQVMSTDRFEATGAAIEIVLDADGSSAPANVEQILRRLAREGRADAFFTCGSNRLMQLMQRVGRELNISGQVAMEQQMACGIGMCFSCVRNFRGESGIVSRRVCWDGPVFDLQEALAW